MIDWWLFLVVPFVLFVIFAVLQWYGWYTGEYDDAGWWVMMAFMALFLSAMLTVQFFSWNWVVALATFAAVAAGAIVVLSVKKVKSGE